VGELNRGSGGAHHANPLARDNSTLSRSIRSGVEENGVFVPSHQLLSERREMKAGSEGK